MPANRRRLRVATAGVTLVDQLEAQTRLGLLNTLEITVAGHDYEVPFEGLRKSRGRSHLR
jgi:hypothetical protein